MINEQKVAKNSLKTKLIPAERQQGKERLEFSA